MPKKFIPAFLLTFVNVLGFSVLMPVLPFVVDSYGAPKWVYGLLITFYSSFQFLGASYLGGLSDQFGRKKILLVSQAGTLISWFIFLLALSLPSTPVFGFALPLYIIAISRILDGITGGNASVTNAYVADITTLKEKSFVFGYLGGIAGLGMIVGPSIGGFTSSSSLGFVGTLLAAILISVITLATIFFWLKESLPQEKRTTQKSNSIFDALFIFKKIKELNPNPTIKLLFTLKFFFSTMIACYIATIALFIIDTFHFNTKELGIFLFVVGLFLAFNQAFLSKQFIRKFGQFPTLIIGLCLTIFGLVSITLTTNLYLYITFYYFMNLGLSLCFPTFNSLISIHADPKKQGQTMGISESINSLAMALFPVIAATLYGFLGGQFYYFVCIMPLIALIILVIKTKHLKSTHTT